MFLGNVGPAEVQGNWLSADNPAEHEWGDGSAAVQINLGPESLVTTPGCQKERFVLHVTLLIFVQFVQKDSSFFPCSICDAEHKNVNMTF